MRSFVGLALLVNFGNKNIAAAQGSSDFLVETGQTVQILTAMNLQKILR
jgi:hypothetical protein